MPKLVHAVINDCGDVEIVVQPEFYDLSSAECKRQWNATLRSAAEAGFYLFEALVPDCDPSWSQHIDLDGTEHHYLVTHEMLDLDQP